MTNIRHNSKRGGTDVIMGKEIVGGASLTLHYGLIITHSYPHIGQIHSSKMIQETVEKFEIYTHDMGNEKFNGNLDRNNPSLPLSEG